MKGLSKGRYDETFTGEDDNPVALLKVLVMVSSCNSCL